MKKSRIGRSSVAKIFAMSALVGAGFVLTALAPVTAETKKSVRPHGVGPVKKLTTAKPFVKKLPNLLMDEEYKPKAERMEGSDEVYTLTIKQFDADIFGDPKKLTKVWGYALPGKPATYPGPTFDFTSGTGRGVRINYVNGLVDINGKPLLNPMPVDLSLDWANPGALGGLAPVPSSTHLHGSKSYSGSDGLPDAWGTPGDSQTGRLFARPYYYENSTGSGMLWYHDHALGVTRTNVYMGLAGLYFLRDANENRLRFGGAGKTSLVKNVTPVLPSGAYELPIVIQDRMFTEDGALFYPQELLDETGAKVVGVSVPSVIPEFFGDTILVNGKLSPIKEVEPRKNRLRILNGSDSRFYDLKLASSNLNVAAPGLMVIGNELGLLHKPAWPSANGPNGPAGVLSIAPGERYDVIVDFSGLKPGTTLTLTNSAAAPYPDGDAVDPNGAGKVMQFVVGGTRSDVPNASVTANTSLRTGTDAIPAVSTGTPAATRKLILVEGMDGKGRLMPMIGTLNAEDGYDLAGKRTSIKNLQGTLTYQQPITETPIEGTEEVWEIYNATVDAHPIHLHLVDFRVVNRQAFVGTITDKHTGDITGKVLSNVSLVAGSVRKPGDWESGYKDTVQTFPGEVTRIRVRFTKAGEYVYHCHILSHEDHEMMRRYIVLPKKKS